ncbi:MAG TPA: tetratricopeptide repeat protein [Candidatus Polarisedimenticolia bacterium]|nr:tetratricopeptide repeat protein [Candidatus Polarisedimenticolia bacterium]
MRRIEAPGRRVVIDAPLLGVGPRLVAPGLHLLPRGLFRVTTYPDGEARLRVDLTGDRAPHSREGSQVDLEASLAYTLPETTLLALHRAHGPDVERFLEATVASVVGERLAALSYDVLRDRDPQLASQARAALEGRLGPDGVAVASLKIVQVAAAGEKGGAILRAGTAALPRRIVLVGLDSFTWRIADPLMQQGRMPHLKALVDRGARANLRTITPILSPVIWTSIATGMKPSRHGIVDFVVSARDTGALVPVTSAMRRVPALWNVLSRQEVGVDVVAWWASWPAEPVLGRIVSDRVAFQLFDQAAPDWKSADPDKARGKTSPADLFPEILPMIKAPSEVTDGEVAPYLGRGRGGHGTVAALPGLTADQADLVRQFRTVVAAGQTYHAIARHLLQHPAAGGAAGSAAAAPSAGGAGPHVSLFYYEGPDTASHLFMRDRPPLLPGVRPDDAALFGAVVDRYYETQDRYLGEIVEDAGPDATVIVVSDHGFKSGDDRPADSDPRIDKGRAAEWHSPIGVLAMAGPDVRRGADLEAASILDVAPTILALLGLPAARDMDGQPLTEAFTPDFARAHPVAWIDTYGGARADDDETLIASAGDDQLVEKLRSIGYIGDERLTAQNNRGLIALDEGDVDGAIAHFEGALAKGAGTAEIRLNLARAYIQKGDLARARSTAASLLAQDPRAKQAEVTLAVIDIKEGHLPEAEAALRRALAVDPNLQLAHTKLGEVLQKQGQDDAALAEFERSVAISPLSPIEHNHIGNLHRKHGRLPQAMQAYRDAIRADPRYAGAYNNLGLCLQEKGKLDEAEALYQKALAIRPENAVLHNSVATLRALQGRREEALAETEKALAADPDWPVAAGNKATLLFELGRLTDARPAFEHWVTLEPDAIEGRLGWALTLLAAGQPQDAATQFQEVLKRDPANLRAHVALGETYLRAGDLARAQEQLEAAVRSGEPVPRAWNSLGEVYSKRGLPDQAAAAFRKSLAIDPKQPDIRARLAGGR